jgi:hypothetical protein
MKDNTYNGWRNYETWNVALWLQNEEALYELTRCVDDYAEFIQAATALDLARTVNGAPIKQRMAHGTPDGIKWNDPKVDVEELNEMLWTD